VNRFVSWLRSLGTTREAAIPRVGRNDPCPCGSGKKFKACCIDKASTATLENAASRAKESLLNKSSAASRALQRTKRRK